VKKLLFALLLAGCAEPTACEHYAGVHSWLPRAVTNCQANACVEFAIENDRYWGERCNEERAGR
jgi:hypothetical protein